MATASPFVLRKRPTYYKVFALKDGTIWTATPARKPSSRNRDCPEKIDQENIFRWMIEEPDMSRLSEAGKVIKNVNIATCLNVKRIIREKVEGKLDRILEKLEAIEARLDRIEEGRAPNRPAG